RRRDKQVAKRLLRKLLKKQMRPPRVMITDKLARYGAAKKAPKPAKPEPNRLKYTQETRGAGGEVEAAADGALPRAPRRGALLLRPDHRHRHAAWGLLCEGDDGISFCAADPGLRLSAICRTAS